MKQRFSTERKGRPECHPVRRIANTGLRRLSIGFLLVGVLVAFVTGAQTPAVQKGAEPAPVFAKSFAPDTIGPGGVSTLTFTIDNSASALAAASLAFTDNLPAGVTIASPSNATTTCTGGTLTATSGSSVISYSGGSVSAGASCTVQVDVTTSGFGVLVNTSGDLTSSSGNSGPATDTLTVVIVPPTFENRSRRPRSVPARFRRLRSASPTTTRRLPLPTSPSPIFCLRCRAMWTSPRRQTPPQPVATA